MTGRAEPCRALLRRTQSVYIYIYIDLYRERSDEPRERSDESMERCDESKERSDLDRPTNFRLQAEIRGHVECGNTYYWNVVQKCVCVCVH